MEKWKEPKREKETGGGRGRYYEEKYERRWGGWKGWHPGNGGEG